MKFDQPTTKRMLNLIFLIMLMDIIGMSILFPIAPYIVQRYSSNALMVTMLTVIYAGAQFIAAPALGKISDRVGRRPVLLASVFGSAIGYFIFGISGALWVLFLARLIDGITGGNLSVASACIADISKPEERAKNFTLIGMAYGIGFIIGPALGGLLGQWNLNAPVYLAGIVCLISTALIYFQLPESLPKERRANPRLSLNDFNPVASVMQMMVKPGLGLILWIIILFNFTFDGINSVAGIFIKDKFSASPLTLGLLLLFVGLATAFVQSALIGRLVPRFGEKRMALVGLLGNVIGWPLLMLAPKLWMLFPIAAIQSGISGFIWATTGALAASHVRENEQGQLAGVNAALAGLMSMLGPLWAGAVYDGIMPSAPYWMGAIILSVACLLVMKIDVRAQRNIARVASPAD